MARIRVAAQFVCWAIWEFELGQIGIQDLFVLGKRFRLHFSIRYTFSWNYKQPLQIFLIVKISLHFCYQKYLQWLFVVSRKCKNLQDLPVNSKLITCKAYIYFSAISTCISKLRIYGDFRQHVIPTVIMCLLRGTPCYTGFSYNFHGENICSVLTKIFYPLGPWV